MSKLTGLSTSLGELVELTPELAETLVSVAGDIALVIDPEGVIRQVAFSGSKSPVGRAEDWVGRHWSQTVTTDTREKVDLLLHEVAATGLSRARQVNHPSDSGADIPFTYTAIRLGERGRVLALGRDLGVVSAIQHKLIETQQAMERDYWQMRQAETRYRLLFQIATDAVLVVDAGTMRVLDANRAAGGLYGVEPEKLVGRAATFGIDPASHATVEELLTAARVTGRAAEVRVHLADGRSEARLSATPFRSEGSTLLLVRLRSVDVAGNQASSIPYADFIERTADAVVFSDASGVVLAANPAFLDLVQLANEGGAKGRSLGDWIDCPGSDLNVILAMLKKNANVRLLATSIRGEHGQPTEVELSAVSMFEGERRVIGFVIRCVERRIVDQPSGTMDLARTFEQLTGQLGRVSLPNLVQETTDAVERHLIAEALRVSKNNRTSAAEILGVSRQSLYVKLRRYQLDSGKNNEES